MASSGPDADADASKKEKLQTSVWKTRQKEDRPRILSLAKSQIPDYREDGPELSLFSDFDACPVPTNPGKLQTAVAIEKLEATIKREQERLKKEKEKNDKKAVKELERALREQKKQEEKIRKQAARLEKAKEREAKKKEQQERKERKREEMAVSRRRDVALSRRDDADVEWDELCAKWRQEKGVTDEVKLVEGEVEGLVRPSWPPEGVELVDVWSIAAPEAQLQHGEERKLNARDSPVGLLTSAWSFLTAFSSLLAIEAPSLDGLTEGLLQGSASASLFKIHAALLRLIQVDAEESKGMSSGATSSVHHKDSSDRWRVCQGVFHGCGVAGGGLVVGL